jgi:4'-phosphopantetheinyl transferase
VPILPLRNITTNTTLGFWKITETEKELLEIYTPTVDEADFFSKFKPEKRLHFLASRALLYGMFPQGNLQKDSFGKPFFSNSDVKMSWSHSGKYAAVILCNNAHTGIDIERYSDRVVRIQHKFINPTDAKSLHEFGSNLKELLVIWGVKESLYKYYGKKGLDFNDHMSVMPFILRDNDKLLANIHHPNYRAQLKLGYDFFDDHVAVWIEEELF